MLFKDKLVILTTVMVAFCWYLPSSFMLRFAESEVNFWSRRSCILSCQSAAKLIAFPWSPCGEERLFWASLQTRRLQLQYREMKGLNLAPAWVYFTWKWLFFSSLLSWMGLTLINILPWSFLHCVKPSADAENKWLSCSVINEVLLHGDAEHLTNSKQVKRASRRGFALI